MAMVRRDLIREIKWNLALNEQYRTLLNGTYKPNEQSGARSARLLQWRSMSIVELEWLVELTMMRLIEPKFSSGTMTLAKRWLL